MTRYGIMLFITFCLEAFLHNGRVLLFFKRNFQCRRKENRRFGGRKKEGNNRCVIYFAYLLDNYGNVATKCLHGKCYQIK